MPFQFLKNPTIMGPPGLSGLPWFRRPEYAGMAAILDFNNDRYAIPADLTAGQVAGATVAQLTNLRQATRDELFSQYTYSGTTERTYFDASGTLKSDLLANVARFDYANGKRQLLLEPSVATLQTNTLLQGGTTGIPGNWPTSYSGGLVANQNREILGYGVEDGIPYVEARWWGTSTGYAGLFATSTLAMTPTENRTGSIYVRHVAGTLPAGLAAIFYATPNFNDNISQSLMGITNAPLRSQRVVLSRQFAVAGNTGTTINLAMSPTGPYDFTLRIGMPQIEPGLYATSNVPGGVGVAPTRNTEIFRLSPLVEAIMQRAEGTAVIRGQGIVTTANSSGTRLLGGPATNRIVGFTASGLAVGGGDAGGGTGFVQVAGPVNPTPAFGTALSWDAAGKSVSYNGNVPGTIVDPMLADRTVVHLGRDASNNYAAGRYDFLGILPTRATDAKVRELAVAA